ncbi:glycosyltransferase family 2 protein [Geomonas sp. Red421]|uniref:Glycosyltransferase family 2 protein n=1 Tax=Geomonas anaerohicana TaxID=2798583 RepID=A0ABS0YGK1_9BACT|nr:glycosyltransferase family 2 protein [Geomonas anaerohicana]
MRPDTPLVTVVIPCFNMGGYVAEAVASVRAQTFRDFEVIVVDDGSDDPGTLEELRQVAAGGVTVLRTPNRGVAAARNEGVGAARGRYILPLDGDDLLFPHALERMVAALKEEPEVDIVSCDAELTGGAAGVLSLPEFCPVRQLSENLLFASALYRKSDWQRVGGYCTGFRFGWEDWDFWIAMTRGAARVARVPEPLFQYRIRPDSRDRSMALWQKGAMVLLILLRHAASYLRSPASLLRLVANARGMNRNRP